jgi:hypothetical protein
MIWWDLPKVTSRREPFRLKLGEVYEQLERSPP